MKRISNNVAVQTILQIMHPQMNVKIFDINHELYSSSERFDRITYGVTTEQVDKILHELKYTTICRSQVRRIDINDGVLMLVIDTSHDEYY